MKKLLRTLVIAACFALSFACAQAQVITAERAQEIANSFFRNSKQKNAAARSTAAMSLKKSADSRILSSESSSDAPTFHILTPASGKGFVIVSGEEMNNPIIGYSFDSEFITKGEIPTGLTDYLADIDAQVKALRKYNAENPQKAAAARNTMQKTNYAADTMGDKVYLETASWGQNTPFNDQCWTNTSQTVHAKTGCVPTAYAIIMRYHEWPLEGIGNLYNCQSGIKITDRTYDYSKMPLVYDGNWSEEQINEVAKLMSHLGHAFMVTFGSSSTSVSDPQSTDKPNIFFNYNLVYASYQEDFTMDTWKEKIKESIDNGCPIPYASDNAGTGDTRHMFVLDGYTVNDYFHFNFGWNGGSNGWFKLDAIKPSQGDNYSWQDGADHYAIFNFTPNKTKYTVNASVSPTNAGTVSINGGTVAGSATGEYLEGATATLAATANTGYTFSNWTKGSEIVSTSKSCQVKVASSDNDYVANFLTVGNTTVNISVTYDSNKGTIKYNGNTVTGTGITPYQNEEITLTAEPVTGYVFSGWTVEQGTESTNYSGTSLTLVATSEMSITANFALAAADYIISPSTTGVSGTSKLSNVTYQTTTENPAALTLKATSTDNSPVGVLGISRIDDDRFRLYAYATNETGSTSYTTVKYTLTAPDGYIISKYSFDYTLNSTAYPCTIIYDNGKTITPSDTDWYPLSVTVNAQTAEFTLTATTSHTSSNFWTRNFTVSLEKEDAGSGAVSNCNIPGDNTLRYYRFAIAIAQDSYENDFESNYDKVKQFWQECEDFMNEMYVPLGMCFDVVVDEKLLLGKNLPTNNEDIPEAGGVTDLINDAIGSDSYDIGICICYRETGVENTGLSKLEGAYSSTTKANGYAKADKWVVAHEVGHLFGADHTPQGENSLMDNIGEFFSYPSIKIIRTKSVNNGTVNAYRSEVVANNAPTFTALMKETYKIPQGACLSIPVYANDADGHSLRYAAMGCSSSTVEQYNGDNGELPHFASLKPQTSNVLEYSPEFVADGDSYYLPVNGTDIPSMSAGSYSIAILVNDMPAENSYDYLTNNPFYSNYDVWDATVEIVDGTPFTASVSPSQNSYTAGSNVTVTWGVNSNYFTEESRVRITMSSDYGKTFSHVLAEDVRALDGCKAVTLPNVNVGNVDVDFSTKYVNALRSMRAGIIRVEVIDGAAYTLTAHSPENGGGFNITGAGAVPEPVQYTVTTTANPTEGGTTKVSTGTNQTTTSVTVDSGTEVTLYAVANSGYAFVKWTNGTSTISEEATANVTITANSNFIANFEKVAVILPDYPTPTGYTYTDNYLTSITTTGGDTNIDYSANEHPNQLLVVVPGKVQLAKGESFTMNLAAKSLGEGSNSTVHEDMRYCHASLFTDFDQDHTFQEAAVQTWGNNPPSNNVYGNYDEVMDITHTITVPDDAPAGESRVRIIYTNAWNDWPSNGTAELDKGIVYDIVVEVVEKVDYTIEENAYYRFTCAGGDKKNLTSATDANDNNRLVMGNANDLFYYSNSTLLAYHEGKHLGVVSSAGRYNITLVTETPVKTSIVPSEGLYYIAIGSSGDYGNGYRYLFGAYDNIDSGTQETGYPTADGYKWNVEKASSLPVNFGKTGWATIFAPVALEIPDGVTAYYVMEDGIKNGYISLTTIEEGVIPANTGVILYAKEADGTDKTYEFAITDCSTELTANLLKGSIAQSIIEEKGYVLAVVEGAVGLYSAITEGLAEKTFLNNSHKAYLPASAIPAALQQSTGFRFGEGVTDIDNVKTENEKSETIYDMQGRKVENPAKGIYIINGKKTFIR